MDFSGIVGLLGPLVGLVVGALTSVAALLVVVAFASWGFGSVFGWFEPRDELSRSIRSGDRSAYLRWKEKERRYQAYASRRVERAHMSARYQRERKRGRK